MRHSDRSEGSSDLQDGSILSSFLLPEHPLCTNVWDTHHTWLSWRLIYFIVPRNITFCCNVILFVGFIRLSLTVRGELHSPLLPGQMLRVYVCVEYCTRHSHRH